jgi:glycosyltransferase involved in cell wall biosynthesis
MRVSVVIPTRGRAAELEQTLEALARQRPPTGGFEVLVASDGEDPDTVALLERPSPCASVPVIPIAASTPGPAAARNAGIAAATGELVLFLGDDTAPVGDDLVLRHAELHAGTPPTYGVLGQVVWDGSKQATTPFMRWLGESGIQFAFDRLVPGPVSASRYLYTAHLSLKRDFLRAVGGFDERFPFAAVEDVELGARLDAADLDLHYHPELLVAHDHPTTLDQSLVRVERVGRSAVLYGALHPERPHPDLQAPSGWGWSLLVAAQPLLRGAARLPLPGPVRGPLWRLLHLGAYARGRRLGPPSSPGSREAAPLDSNGRASSSRSYSGSGRA